MDSRWRDKLQAILDDMRCCDPSKTVHWAHRIEDVLKEEREQPILPPQRSMTPEEVAGMRAYRETVFKRVAAEGDGLRDEVRACLGTLIDDICNHRTISALTRVTQLEDAIAALASEKAAPQCLGYPDCDGDLPGEPHEQNCPLYNTRNECPLVGCGIIGPHEHKVSGPVASPEDGK